MKSVIGLLMYRLGRVLLKVGAKLMLDGRGDELERIRPNIVLNGHSK